MGIGKRLAIYMLELGLVHEIRYDKIKNSFTELLSIIPTTGPL